MNAHCNIPDPSQSIERFLIGTTLPIRILDPHRRQPGENFLPEDGPIQALVIPGPGGDWIVFPGKSFLGLSKVRWLKLWEDAEVEIKRATENGWEDINGL